MHTAQHQTMQQPKQPTTRPPVSEGATPPAYQPHCASGPKPGQTPAHQHTRRSPATGDAPAAEPDLVDRIFEYIFSDPAMARAVQAMAQARQQGATHGDTLQHLKTAVRAEFQGERCYITARPATERQQRVAQVLQLFNGRNATEVARRLQISRRSVYAYIKQARTGGS